MSGYSSPYAAFAQVELPIDPGVVLLDIGFTGTDNNHGTRQMDLTTDEST